MRIAHIIVAHKNPDQLQRLIKRLEHNNFDIFIHLDKKTDITPFKKLEQLKNVTFIKNRMKCSWGGNNFLIGIFNSIREVLSNNKEYDFINLISGQDYPIQSADVIYNFFKDRKGYNFISYEEDQNSEWLKLAAMRYEKYHLTDFDFKGKHLFERALNIVAPKRKFPTSYKLYGGPKATWWTITGECAVKITELMSTNDKLNNFLKYCWGADELIIPTLVMHTSDKSKVVNNNLRYIDWSEGNAHPKMLKSSDFDKIINSKNIFARKFDSEIDDAVLNEIDSADFQIELPR
ncbi:beta-1,6-N-acetylglucosaminyltransferase [Pedobacter aquatilis]|uniref:beta-1,6-N-acetylglucosaminyltransferase n=1 Tax=Pedobacter aquatilis TaxID=351343 RepID=UPI00292F9709|nr:beta-1,6-N-acetylglucosaminyltransferase [Pedobacter aquatilis]